MIRLLLAVALLLLVALLPLSWRPAGIKVGSKKFTEGVILGELLAQLAREGRAEAAHYRELGGTRLVYQALLQGEIDLYADYTGTIVEEILSGQQVQDADQMHAALAQRGILISQPLGFNNTYALGMKKERAAELDIAKISDLARHPDLACGFSNEFMNRQDGWPNLLQHYDLPQREVQGIDHDVAYRQLRYGAIDVMDVYTTDAKIETYDLTVLEDDRDYFPRYDAVLLYRADLAERFPEATESILRLEGQITEAEMMLANARVEFDHLTETRVAADLLDTKFGITVAVEEPTAAGRIWQRTLEHFDLVRRSLIPAILIAIPLGVAAAKWNRCGQFILACVGVVQTIPALALLVVLMPLMAAVGLATIGLGSATAVTALLLYSLLPIVRNTYTGLHDLAGQHREAAAALGLPPWFRLTRIEMPLASRSILAGIKTAAILNIGFATLGALIGAGGYGQPIITGIRLNDTGLILEGAVPAALLALLAQGVFELAERYFVPRGLRIKHAE